MQIMHKANWYVYIVRCADNSLYTGVAMDTDKRIDEHNHDDKLAARYTRVRRPVSLVYCEIYKTRSEAQSREYAIKQLSKAAKEKIVLSYNG